MSQDSVERFLGRLITDDAFREQARDCLASACVENGFALTDEEMKSLEKLKLNLDRFEPLSGFIDRGIKRSRRCREFWMEPEPKRSISAKTTDDGKCSKRRE